MHQDKVLLQGQAGKGSKEVKNKVLEIASRKCGLNIDELDIREGIIIEKKMGDEALFIKRYSIRVIL